MERYTEIMQTDIKKNAILVVVVANYEPAPYYPRKSSHYHPSPCRSGHQHWLCAPRQCSWCNSDSPASSTLRPIRNNHEQCRPCRPIRSEEAENLSEICFLNEGHSASSAFYAIPQYCNVSIFTHYIHLNPCKDSWPELDVESTTWTLPRYILELPCCMSTNQISLLKVIPCFQKFFLCFLKRECALNYPWCGC